MARRGRPKKGEKKEDVGANGSTVIVVKQLKGKGIDESSKVIENAIWQNDANWSGEKMKESLVTAGSTSIGKSRWSDEVEKGIWEPQPNLVAGLKF